jgi:hypothetical protein
MFATVNLYYKVTIKTYKINNIWADGLLSAELCFRNLLASEFCPKGSLSIGLIAMQLTRNTTFSL